MLKMSFATLQKYSGANVVAAQQVVAQLFALIDPFAATPQVMMRVDDWQIRLKDLLLTFP